MIILSILKFGDFDMKYTDSLWVGNRPLPKNALREGMLEEELEAVLKEHGFSNDFKNQEVTLSDDYYCSDENPENRNDRRLRISRC